MHLTATPFREIVIGPINDVLRDNLVRRGKCLRFIGFGKHGQPMHEIVQRRTTPKAAA